MTVKVSINIDSLLKKHRISMRKLNDLSGVRLATLSELSNNKREYLSFTDIRRIANALNITDINEIMSLVETDEIFDDE